MAEKSSIKGKKKAERKEAGEVGRATRAQSTLQLSGRSWDPSIPSLDDNYWGVELCPGSRAHSGGQNKAPVPVPLSAREETKDTQHHAV